MRKNTDIVLESTIRKRLRKDPPFYIELFKRLIDEVSGDISQEDLLDFLKPSFTRNPPIDSILRNEKDVFMENDLIVSPESVDLFFYPQVRRKLKELQKAFFASSATQREKKEIRNFFNKISTHLLFSKQGRKRELSPENESNIIVTYDHIQKQCERIIEGSKRNVYNRKSLIRKKFPDVADKINKLAIIEELPSSKTTRQKKGLTPERLRNLILARRYNCSVRQVEEIIRRNKVEELHRNITPVKWVEKKEESSD